MRVLILGATGPVGILIIREALATLQTLTLVLYVRSPEKLPDDISSHPDVVVIKGQLTDTDALSKAMEGVDAVISTLGPAVQRGPFHPGDTPLAKAYRLLIELMHTHNVTRLIALGTASIRDPNDKFSYQFWTLINGVALLARNAYKDVVAIGKVIRDDGNDLDWTVVRVPVLTNQENKDVVAGYVGDGKVKTSLSRAALAYFMIEELQHGEWIKKAPLISHP